MVKTRLNEYKYIIWYSLCVIFLGVIDQRRGSAPGHIQIIFANLVGVAVFFFLFPSMKKEFVRWKGTRILALVSAIALPVFILVIKPYVDDWGLWSTGAINVVCVLFLMAYIWWDRKTVFKNLSIIKSGYGMLMLCLLFMYLSINRTVWPGLYFLLFGCFYLIGIPKERQEHCMLGILFGLAIWFVGQQCIAFGFRPYDYYRYKGLYSGETQNGLFYMIAFCAFTGLVLYAGYKKRKKIWSLLAFVLSAGCGGLLLLTGGKSSLLGVVVGGTLAYFMYDCIIRKSAKHWLLQLIALGACVLLLLPAVYGCVRYLPTILHHPIWFEGEYDEDRSVRSFDPWYSERYVSFERAIENNVGRIFKVVGIEIEIEDGQLHIQTPFSTVSDAAEPGSSKDNPYLTGKTPKKEDGTLDPARVAIWKYYIKHLNFEGHNGLIFYYREGRAFGNAHNMFLHMAVLYGIVPGVLYLVWNGWCFIRVLRRKDMVGITTACLMSAIFAYGMFEQATTSGQITLSLLFILYYFGMEKQDSKEKLHKLKK